MASQSISLRWPHHHPDSPPCWSHLYGRPCLLNSIRHHSRHSEFSMNGSGMKKSYHLLSNYYMSDPKQNALERKNSFIVAILKMRGPQQVRREVRTRPRLSLTSKPDTQAPCYTVHHTQALESSVLNSGTRPKMYNKIQNLQRGTKLFPSSGKVKFTSCITTFPSFSKCFMYAVLR